MAAMRLPNEKFDQYVNRAIETIDPRFDQYLQEVPIIVENQPGSEVKRMNLPSGRILLGLFCGVPLNRRSVTAGSGPNHIVLYRENILAVCQTKEQLVEQIRKTLVHELGHYLGFSEEQLGEHKY